MHHFLGDPPFAQALGGRYLPSLNKTIHCHLYTCTDTNYRHSSHEILLSFLFTSPHPLTLKFGILFSVTTRLLTSHNFFSDSWVLCSFFLSLISMDSLSLAFVVASLISLLSGAHCAVTSQVFDIKSSVPFMENSLRK